MKKKVDGDSVHAPVTKCQLVVVVVTVVVIGDKLATTEEVAGGALLNRTAVFFFFSLRGDLCCVFISQAGCQAASVYTHFHCFSVVGLLNMTAWDI